jgi:hypothetical protein
VGEQPLLAGILEADDRDDRRRLGGGPRIGTLETIGVGGLEPELEELGDQTL